MYPFLVFIIVKAGKHNYKIHVICLFFQYSGLNRSLHYLHLKRILSLFL